jgi:hypothetical protein
VGAKGEGAADETAEAVISVLATSVAVVVVSQSFISTVSSQTEQTDKAWLKDNIEKPARQICTGSPDPYPSESGFVERDLQFSDFSVKTSGESSRRVPRHTLEVRGEGGDIKHELFIIKDACDITVEDSTSSGADTKKFRVQEKNDEGLGVDVEIIVNDGGS